MGFEIMHLVPGSSQTYCLTLLKFTGLFGHPFLVWTDMTVGIIFSLSHSYRGQLSLLSVCLQHSAPGRSDLGSLTCFTRHEKNNIKEVRNKGQSKSLYFFSGTSETSLRLDAWQAVPTAPLKADLFCSVFNPINTTFLFAFLLSLPKE